MGKIFQEAISKASFDPKVLRNFIFESEEKYN